MNMRLTRQLQLWELLIVIFIQSLNITPLETYTWRVLGLGGAKQRRSQDAALWAQAAPKRVCAH